ncbi:hypothetical protein [Polaromonas sp.]|uniref:hypothetical protein n=1 Tax=Polaromonas sp. TaxID=1869339 RepID=UPI002FC897D1
MKNKTYQADLMPETLTRVQSSQDKKEGKKTCNLSQIVRKLQRTPWRGEKIRPEMPTRHKAMRGTRCVAASGLAG